MVTVAPTGKAIFIGRYLTGVMALAVAVGGCALQRHPASGSPAPTSTSPVATQHQNSGWYLMQPAVRHGNPDPKAKLEEWQVLAFFDRSAQCDEARQRGLKAYPSYVMVSESEPLDSVQMSQRLASSSLCVDASDPRINWFHIKWK
jgi:hypothetical protein